MRRHTVRLAVVLTLLAANYHGVRGSGPVPNSLANDLAELQGSWEMIAVEVNGEAREKELPSFIWTFRQNRLTLTTATYTTVISIALDPVKQPHWLAFGENEILRSDGIYRVRGNMLQICLGWKRPQEFQTKTGSGETLISLKRAK